MTDERKFSIGDKRRKRWYWVDHEILDVYGPELGAYGIAVYNVLCRRADDDGESFPSYEGIARMIGCTRRQVMKVMADLTRLGLIRKETRTEKGKGNTSNLYTVLDVVKLPSEPHSPVLVNHIHQPSEPESPEEYPLNKNHSSKNTTEGANAPRGVNPATGELPPSKNEKPAAVQVYREVMHLYPAKAWYDAIVAAVGEDGLSLQRWRDVCMQWIGRGYSPKNIEGVIEVFKAGWRKVAKADKKPAQKPDYLGGKFGNEIQH